MNKSRLVFSLMIADELLFVLAVWYTYVMYSHVTNLIFALFITIGILSINLWHFVYNKSDSNKSMIYYKKVLEQPIWLILLCSLPILLFFIFMMLSLTYGGSSVSVEYAEEYIEAYEVGKYFLTNKGIHTEVNFGVWRFMGIMENVWIVTIALAAVGIITNKIISKKKNNI